jgi:hypothetical protein
MGDRPPTWYAWAAIWVCGCVLMAWLLYRERK